MRTAKLKLTVEAGEWTPAELKAKQALGADGLLAGVIYEHQDGPKTLAWMSWSEAKGKVAPLSPDAMMKLWVALADVLSTHPGLSSEDKEMTRHVTDNYKKSLKRLK